MDGSHSEGLDSKITEELKPETQASKRRKVVQKTVVTVKIEANEGKQRSEGPPSDCWSWRKYGQKPIKGSPYPRGYYRCSTSKGCSAKKQVERSRTDASMLIITYTSSHNHPGPVLPTTNNLTVTNTEHSKLEPPTEDQPTTTTPQKDLEQEAQDQDQQPLINSEEDANEDHFHYSQSPFNNSQENPFAENLENTTTYEAPSVVLFEEEPLSCYNPPLPPPLMAFSAIDKSEEEYDFYDELEELPSSSSSSSSSSFFTSFLRNNFFDERILVHPS